MNTTRLAAMLTDAVSFDVESHKFQPGLSAPPVVCMATAHVVDGKIVGALYDRQQAVDVLLELLKSNKTLVNVNIAFDMLVIAVDAARLRGLDLRPYIFDAYTSGRVYDPAIAESLHHIGLGCLGVDPRTGRKFSDRGYSLGVVHELVTGRANAKVNDKWRTSYGLLGGWGDERDIPIAKWREVAGHEAVEYPIDDTCNALEDALAQAGLIPNIGRHDFINGQCQRCKLNLVAGMNPVCTAITRRMNMHDIANQTYTAFCMLLGAAWGVRPDPITVATLRYRVHKDLAVDILPFEAAGISWKDPAGKWHTREAVLKKLVAQAYGASGSCGTCGRDQIFKGRKNAKHAETAPPGKVINKNGNGWNNCKVCDGTGLLLIDTVPRSDSGEVSCKRDYLNESGDEFLMAFAEFGELDKVRETYIPWMEEAIRPDCRLTDDQLTESGLEECLTRIRAALASGEQIVKPITLSPNVLLETNRCSDRSKIQTLPRKGGVRNCFVPDDGFGYYSCDYTGIELATWAQICIWMLGKSDMADALNGKHTGGVPLNAHGKLGAIMCGMDYFEFMKLVKSGSQREKDFRQCAKWGNFGFMGGAGGRRLAIQIREQGEDTPHPDGPIAKTMRDGSIMRFYKGTRPCLLIGGKSRCGIVMSRVDKKGEPAQAVCAACIECCEWIRENWFKAWSEAKAYFERCKEIGKRGFQIHPTSQRVRGGIGFTDGANGFFQELAACGAKAAHNLVAREQHDSSYVTHDTGERSILFNNSRNLALLHDELFGIGRLEVLPEVAERVCVAMKWEMKKQVPDVNVDVEPTIMDRWYKEAAMVRDSGGRLVIWQPKGA